MNMIRTSAVAVVAALATGLGASAAEFLCYDKTYTFQESENGFHYFDPQSGSPADWTSPDDYYNGRMYVRHEVFSVPSNTAFHLQICIWQDWNPPTWLENCAKRPKGQGPCVITSDSCPATDWWRYEGKPVDFSRPDDYRHIGVVLWSDTLKNVSSWVSGGDWDRRALWLPMELRTTVVFVSQGSTFSGWENYIGGGPVVTKPGVSTNNATDIGPLSARLNGEVTSTGGENPAVMIYWGDNDGGTNSGSWDLTESLGIKGAGTFYKDVTGLTVSTTYYFRCFASNSAGGTWASSSEFFTTTNVGAEPTVTTRPASSVRATSARLNGEVTSTGGLNPTVKIYWGATDGGMNAASWGKVEDLGTKGSGTFYADVSGLTEGTTYYFRCFASNSAGDAWASSSESFTAAAPVGGLVGHWTFDDGSGTTAVDSSAKGNDGTVHGATWTTGKIGGALSFGGSDSDYVEIPNEADYDLADAVSYAVWINASPGYATSWMGVITKGDNMNLQTYNKEDYLVWQTEDHPGTISQYQLEETTNTIDGTWHHIAATFDGAEKCIYVDGKLDNSAAATGYINTADNPIMIGKNAQYTGCGLDGLIDDVRIYDYALSLSEVQALYEMGSGGPQDPTITQHPQSVTVTEGEPATFSVTATGSGTLSYQWYEDGSAISGATSATYAISSTDLSQNGHEFHCLVTDSGGSAQSNPATLTVNPPAGQGPTITQHPQSVTVTAGETVTFTVAATASAGTLSYQWKKDGANIAGATSASYTTPATVVADDGAKFTCVVTDDNGSATSGAATLTVNAPVVDTDGDGLPDDWETLYDLDPNKKDTDGNGIQDQYEDPDQDGYTNLQEYQRGTDPTDVNSFPGKTGDSTFCAAGPSGARTGGVATALLLAALCVRIIRGLLSTRRAAERL